MAEQFYTILTSAGKAKIANAAALGTKVNFTHLALGDGGGKYYNPIESQTELVSEVWRGNIGNIAVDEENSSWIVVQTIIPGQVGGFMIREAGIFDDAGDLIAIGKYPETYKPTTATGSMKDLVVRMILEVSNTASVVLKVDPTVILATKKDIDNLAGAGRTTETVKQNADDIASLQQEVAAHLAEIATLEKAGHVKAETDAEGNLILPEIKVDDETVFINDYGELTTLNPYKDDTSGSPGSAFLLAGTMEEGFFGEVSASDLITGDALASLVGISQGTSQNSTVGWLKFAWQGKILFVAKKAFRNSISWDHINSANAVYGDKAVAIDGLSYKIRLLKGVNKDPAGAYSGAICHGSEWNRLMLPIHQEAINKNWAYPDNVESDIPVWAHSLGTGTQGRYTDEDLLTKSDYGSGSYSWCQEVAESAACRVYRGSNGVSYSGSDTSSYTASYWGWRPCLEFSV